MPPDRETTPAAWRAAIDEFLARERGRSISPDSIPRRRRDLEDLAGYMAAHRGRADPRLVTPTDARAFGRYAALDRRVRCGPRRGRRLARSTVGALVTAARSLFAILAEEGRVLLDPFLRVEPPRPCRHIPRGILSVDEARRLLETPDVRTPVGLRDRALLELLYSTGARRAEAVGLRTADVDLAALRVQIRRGKGRKDRVVPIGPKAAAWVRRYLDEARPNLAGGRLAGDALWLGRDGAPLSASGFAAQFRRRVQAAGLGRRATPHSLRHSFATHILLGAGPHAGSAVLAVQRMLGHTRLATTQVYLRVAVTDLKDAHRRAHPRGTGEFSGESANIA